MVGLAHEDWSMTDHDALVSIARNPADQEAVAWLVDSHGWIIEDEVSRYFGRPPWFESAVAAVIVEIIRGAANYAHKKHQAPIWIRTAARRAARSLEGTLLDQHAVQGVIQFESAGGRQESLVRCLLQGRRSPYWEEVRLHKLFRQAAVDFGFGCSELRDVDG
jgi:hypothetical protein